MSSKYGDLIEAEAVAAEASTDDDEAADEETAAPDPEPTPELDMKKAAKAMERENERHAKRVEEIMGADFELVHPCPKCETFAAGFTFEAPEDQPEMLHGAQFERCTDCNGYGAVLTGSLADHGRIQTCLTCSGQGFVNKPTLVTPLPAGPTPVSPHASVADELRAQGYMVIEPPARAPIGQAV